MEEKDLFGTDDRFDISAVPETQVPTDMDGVQMEAIERDELEASIESVDREIRRDAPGAGAYEKLDEYARSLGLDPGASAARIRAGGDGLFHATDDRPLSQSERTRLDYTRAGKKGLVPKDGGAGIAGTVSKGGIGSMRGKGSVDSTARRDAAEAALGPLDAGPKGAKRKVLPRKAEDVLDKVAGGLADKDNPKKPSAVRSFAKGFAQGVRAQSATNRNVLEADEHGRRYAESLDDVGTGIAGKLSDDGVRDPKDDDSFMKAVEDARAEADPYGKPTAFGDVVRARGIGSQERCLGLSDLSSARSFGDLVSIYGSQAPDIQLDDDRTPSYGSQEPDLGIY